METAPESETPFEQRCKRERLRASIAFRIGIAVLILSLLLPCLAAPFLVPYFQLFLLIPFVLGMFYGLLGGWFHNWWVTVGLTTASLAMFVSCDLATDSYGYAALPTYIATGSLPIGAMYYDSWGLLYKVTVIPVGYGLACAVHAAIILRRQRRKRDAESRGCCANCA